MTVTWSKVQQGVTSGSSGSKLKVIGCLDNHQHIPALFCVFVKGFYGSFTVCVYLKMKIIPSCRDLEMCWLWDSWRDKKYSNFHPWWLIRNIWCKPLLAPNPHVHTHTHTHLQSYSSSCLVLRMQYKSIQFSWSLFSFEQTCAYKIFRMISHWKWQGKGDRVHINYTKRIKLPP